MKPLPVTLLAAVVFASGCGGGSSSSSGSAAPSKSAATSAAKKINLVKADVPSDWTSAAHDSSDDADKQIDQQLASCIGVSASDLDAKDNVVDINADDFSKGAPPQGLQVNSSVTVAGSTKTAQKALSLFANDKTTGCLQTVFDTQLHKQLSAQPGVKLGTVAVKKLTPSASGVDGAFGFDISVSVSAATLSIPVDIQILGFLKKHTEVTLMTTAFGPAFPQAQSDELYGKLVDRAKASAV